MKFLLPVLLGTLLLFQPFAALADSYPNNKFGIHLAQPAQEDLERAAALVNSNGGKWGYVTLVVHDNDRNVGKWQEVFDRLRELKLIPIMRLATHGENGNWVRANVEGVDDWVGFLESLRWVVKERHVILFNEVNHATEWGGAVDPEGYAKVAKVYAQKLKEKNSTYVVMFAGLDASAPSSAPWYEDEAWYLRRAIDAIGVDEFNNLFSALSSHSYPNPGFIGSPYTSGRGTVRTYEWELEFLRNLGIKDLPVFITETGWDQSRLGLAQVADNFEAAFEVWLRDGRVIAVTPFVLNYPGAAFTQFSWINPDGSKTPEFERVQSMEKVAGMPPFVEKGAVIYDLPRELVIDSLYHFSITLKNEGQAIWSSDEYYISVDPSFLFTAQPELIPTVRPGETKQTLITVKTNDIVKKDSVKILLKRGESSVLTGETWGFDTAPLPPLEFKIGFYPRLQAQADDLEIQIFDEKEELVYKRKNVKVRGGVGQLEGVPNVAVGRKYRIVALRPHFLPRQSYLTFKRDTNKVSFTIMFPVDFNSDGAFNLNDITSLLKDLRMLKYLIPSSK